MQNIAFLYSGQGCQYPGMGKDFYENFPKVKQIYECGSDILSIDLAKISFEGDAETLAQTAISQPAIFAVSMAANAVVSELCEPMAFAGHSLGEYAALTSAGAFSLENGFYVIGQRAQAMQRAAERNAGAMFAIVGSDEETVVKVCEETAGYVIPVNFNAPAQTVIAGETDAVCEAAERLAGLGAKAVRLAVSSGFHSKLMQPAAEEFYDAIKNIPTNKPSKPFYANATAKNLEYDGELAKYLAKHLVSPVYFHKEIACMMENGAENFVELGPGKVLTMLVKRNFKPQGAYNVENSKTLDKLREILQK